MFISCENWYNLIVYAATFVPLFIDLPFVPATGTWVVRKSTRGFSISDAPFVSTPPGPEESDKDQSPLLVGLAMLPMLGVLSVTILMTFFGAVFNTKALQPTLLVALGISLGLLASSTEIDKALNVPVRFERVIARGLVPLTMLVYFMLDFVRSHRTIMPGFPSIIFDPRPLVCAGLFTWWAIYGRWLLWNRILGLSLTLNGFAPRDYLGFLDFADSRILLRKVGGGYMFIHRMLLEWFAERYVEQGTKPCNEVASGAG
jgi:hypothetical protein